MPWMQAVVERANTAFNSTNIGSVAPTLFEPGRSLLDAATALEIVQSHAERKHFSLWPRSLQESLRATLYDALTRNPRVPVQMIWKPAAGFGIATWEAAGVNGSWTAISVELHSPVPQPSSD